MTPFLLVAATVLAVVVGVSGVSDQVNADPHANGTLSNRMKARSLHSSMLKPQVSTIHDLSKLTRNAVCLQTLFTSRCATDPFCSTVGGDTLTKTPSLQAPKLKKKRCFLDHLYRALGM